MSSRRTTTESDEAVRWRKHYHKDMIAISSYLAVHYPETHFTNKFTEVKQIAEWSGVEMSSLS